jgi:peptidoglycan-associated lipoprotein
MVRRITQRCHGALILGACVLLLAGVGCAHVNQEQLATDLDALRTELRAEQEAQADELGGRIDGVDARLDDVESRQAETARRMEQLEGDLQELEREMGVTIQRLEEAIAFSIPVHFEFDSATLAGEHTPVLDRFAHVYTEYYGGGLITVEGFTDEAGSAAYNMRLGKNRAEGVKSYLTEVAGLDPQWVRTVSYGESPERLVAPGRFGPDAGSENRRVVLVIDQSAGAPASGGSQ